MIVDILLNFHWILIGMLLFIVLTPVVVIVYVVLAVLFEKPKADVSEGEQFSGPTWDERQEWIKQQAAEDERRDREFWEHFWKNYESEFRSRSDQRALDDETVEERRKHGDENFEESWEEFKEKFDQEDDENYAKYYKLLSIPTNATYDEVRKRFRELVLKYHPDRYIGSKKKAAEKFKKIFEAYQKIMERMRVRA